MLRTLLYLGMEQTYAGSCKVWFVPEPFRRAGISSPGALLAAARPSIHVGWSDSPGELRGMGTAFP